ncbi:hypothetical protein JAU75_17505 [Ochrobactrum sp. Q0168]|nr:hypothetical protein [Ochrobactrum sp. Q0168]
MITNEEYMDDLKYLGEIALKFGMDAEFDEIVSAYERAKKKAKITPW